MLLGFGYLNNIVMFYFIFLQKADNNRLKKSQLAKICDIIFSFLLKVASAGLVDNKLSWSCFKCLHRNLFAITFISPSFKRVFVLTRTSPVHLIWKCS